MKTRYYSVYVYTIRLADFGIWTRVCLRCVPNKYVRYIYRIFIDILYGFYRKYICNVLEMYTNRNTVYVGTFLS